MTVTWRDRWHEWQALDGFARENWQELEQRGRMRAVTICMQRTWMDMMRLKGSEDVCNLDDTMDSVAGPRITHWGDNHVVGRPPEEEEGGGRGTPEAGGSPLTAAPAREVVPAAGQDSAGSPASDRPRGGTGHRVRGSRGRQRQGLCPGAGGEGAVDPGRPRGD